MVFNNILSKELVEVFMKIYCPKCHTCYSIEIGLIPVDGKKFRCHKCKEVWLCTHKDIEVKDSNEEIVEENIPQNIPATEELNIIDSSNTKNEDSNNNLTHDINVIFARLQDETTKIDEEYAKLSSLKKFFPKIKKIFGWNSRFSISIELLTILIITLLSIFANRYELVRKFPQMEQVFSSIGIPSKIIGEGLEFQNITRKYLSPDNNNTLSIKGFIFNNTEKELDIPTITVNILNNDTDSVNKIQKKTDIKTIKAKEKVPFNLEVDIPPENAKYILLTFTE